MKTILLSGASGFIGKHLSTHLKKKGYGVVPIPREALYQQDTLRALWDKTKPQYVIHCAAAGNMVGRFQTDRNHTTLIANTLPLFTILEVSRDMPVAGIVNFSSSSVYLPHQTVYSATKKAGEALCKAYYDEYEIPVLSVRPFSVYGPGEANFRFIPTIFRSCLTGEAMALDPSAVHDWIYIQDVVTRVSSLLPNADTFTGGVFDIGTGESVANNTLITLVEELTKKKATITETRRLRSFDTRNWASQLPLMTRTPLLTGLAKTYKFYKKLYG